MVKKSAKKPAKKAVPKPKNQAKTKKPYVSITELANTLGVTQQRVSRAINDGLLEKSVKVIKQGKRNRYEIDEALAVSEWDANIDLSKQRDIDKQEQTRELSSGLPDQSQNFKKAKTAGEVYKAKLIQLEYQIKSGDFISAEQVKGEAYKIGRRVRDSLMAVPERVSAELVSMDDPREISIYLKEQIALALKDLGDLNGISSKGRP